MGTQESQHDSSHTVLANDWTIDEDRLLLKLILDASRNDKRSAFISIRRLKWKVNIPGRSEEEVKNRWRLLLKKVSATRTLFEIASDVSMRLNDEQLCLPFKLLMAKEHNDYPPKPRNASTIYMHAKLRVWEKNTTGATHNVDVLKILRTKFKNTPKAKKTKYFRLEREEQEIYEERKEEFLAAHPEYNDASNMPKIPPTPFSLFLIKNDAETYSPKARAAQREIFEALSPKKMAKFTKHAVDLFSKFFDELVVYVAMNISQPFMPEHVTRAKEAAKLYRKASNLTIQERGGFISYVKDVSADWNGMIWQDKVKKAGASWKTLSKESQEAYHTAAKLAQKGSSDSALLPCIRLSYIQKCPVFVYAFSHFEELKVKHPSMSELEMRALILEQWHALRKEDQKVYFEEGKRIKFRRAVMEAMNLQNVEETPVLPPFSIEALHQETMINSSLGKKYASSMEFEKLTMKKKKDLEEVLREKEESFVQEFKEFVRTATSKALMAYLQKIGQDHSAASKINDDEHVRDDEDSGDESCEEYVDLEIKHAEDDDEELVDPLKLENLHPDSSDYSDDEPVAKKPVARRVQIPQFSSDSEDEDYPPKKTRRNIKFPKTSAAVATSAKRHSENQKRTSTVKSNVSAPKIAKKSLQSPVGISIKQENISELKFSPRDPGMLGKRKWMKGRLMLMDDKDQRDEVRLPQPKKSLCEVRVCSRQRI
ncbi:unnamed protein product [Notodromas monacha]|uniref:Myb-like domain-containing protein n=1 Tax=Notodromas monacha TaxID=399045 RepID=A0A7R9BET0_9CRUS|nr:unnamed protein product [Notodromas monacha]CAG0913981.1 unnamed protein product [Notodromas monacha]